MGEIARGADGRRLFTAEFKKEQIGRLLSGEITQAELCRKFGRPSGKVEVSVVRKWRRLVEQGSQTGHRRLWLPIKKLFLPVPCVKRSSAFANGNALWAKTIEVEFL